MAAYIISDSRLPLITLRLVKLMLCNHY